MKTKKILNNIRISAEDNIKTKGEILLLKLKSEISPQKKNASRRFSIVLAACILIILIAISYMIKSDTFSYSANSESVVATCQDINANLKHFALSEKGLNNAQCKFLVDKQTKEILSTYTVSESDDLLEKAIITSSSNKFYKNTPIIPNDAEETEINGIKMRYITCCETFENIKLYTIKAKITCIDDYEWVYIEYENIVYDEKICNFINFAKNLLFLKSL